MAAAMAGMAPDAAEGLGGNKLHAATPRSCHEAKMIVDDSGG